VARARARDSQALRANPRSTVRPRSPELQVVADCRPQARIPVAMYPNL
jgi:hypothetical protein